MSQTTAPAITMVKGFNGQLSDSPATKDVFSGYAVKEALPLGRLVVVNTANGDGAVMLPTASGDITNLAVGVVLHSHSLESDLTGDPEWPVKSAVPVLRTGRMYVTVEDAVAEGALVYARHDLAPFGIFRSDVDAGKATLVLGARYRSSTAGAGIAIVEINKPA